MDNKERFDQIERLLADLARKSDRQDEFNARQEKHNARVESRLDDIDGQLKSIVGILKISAEAHKQAEERQEQLLREIREQGRRTDITQSETLRLLQALENQQAQLADLSRRTELLEGQEPRIRRLEDEVFRAAS